MRSIFKTIISFCKSRFLLLFLLAQLIIFLVFTYVYHSEVSSHLDSQTKSVKYRVNFIEKQQSVFSNIYFEEVISRKEVLEPFSQVVAASIEIKAKIRAKLFNELKEIYARMKVNHIRQFHFHLPNSHSFLRMHKVEKFGDDLSAIRYSVVQANKSKKIIRGFEEGRIFNGFRNVYPLSLKGKHLGSVEISSSFNGIKNLFKKNFDSDIKFILKKSLVEKKVWICFI